MEDYYPYAINWEANINGTIHSCVQARMSKDYERYISGVESLLFLLRPSFLGDDSEKWEKIEDECEEYIKKVRKEAKEEYETKKHDPLEDPMSHHFNYIIEKDAEEEIYNAEIAFFDRKFEFLCGSKAFIKYGREESHGGNKLKHGISQQ